MLIITPSSRHPRRFDQKRIHHSQENGYVGDNDYYFLCNVDYFMNSFFVVLNDKLFPNVCEHRIKFSRFDL